MKILSKLTFYFLVVLVVLQANVRAWRVAAKPATSKATSTTSSSSGVFTWTWNGKQEPKNNGVDLKDYPALKGTVDKAKPFATDAGIWSAVLFFGFDYLCKRPGQVGEMARTFGAYIHQAVQFPGVAISLFFLFSVPLSKRDDMLGDRGWTWFSKSFPVYLFRFFLQDKVGFLQYFMEGAVGLATAIKMILRTLPDPDKRGRW